MWWLDRRAVQSLASDGKSQCGVPHTAPLMSWKRGGITDTCYPTWVSLSTHSVLVTMLLSLLYSKEYYRTDLRAMHCQGAHPQVLPDPALRLTVGEQTREATV